MAFMTRCFLLSSALATAIAGFKDNEVVNKASLPEVYTFEQYLTDFGKTYPNQQEYQRRRMIFQQNLQRIESHNNDLLQSTSKAGHVLGINRFVDFEPHELPLGYDKSTHKAWNNGNVVAEQRRHLLPENYLPFDLDQFDVTDLPASVDWRIPHHNTASVVTPVKDQGGCGSCWAFASTAVLESHIALQTGILFSLSPQELVSCVPNPLACGGTGGCAGATAELAFDFVSARGMLEEDQMGYTSYHGHTEPCPAEYEDEKKQGFLRNAKSGDNPGHIRGAVATIDGYVRLPSNDYLALMIAVAKGGPVAVSVAASGWGLYAGGVFSDDNDTSPDMNHAVVLVGYGTDDESGEDYWLIRNSWGPRWGENGYIRLKRVDPRTLPDPDQDCSMDVTPADGVACTKDKDGNPVVPPAVKVCGTSGVLFDSALPLGGKVL